MRDIVHNIAAKSALAAAVLTASVASAAIDVKGFESIAFVIHTGAVAGDGDFSARLQESDTTADGDFKDVPATHVQGGFAGKLTANSTAKIGYRGYKRYVRVALTKNSGTSIAAGILAIQSHAYDKPVA